MKPDEIQMETLVQILELRAEINALAFAMSRRLNTPEQQRDWCEDLKESLARERPKLFQQLLSRDATLAAKIRDFFDQTD